MANRSIAAKAARAAREFRAASYVEFTKPLYLAQPSKRDLREMIAGLSGAKVTVCEPGRYVAPEGKSKRRAYRQCYGDGTRRRAGIPEVIGSQ